MSQTYTRSSTFTIQHARHLASKVAADMYICSRYYGAPTADMIPRYQEELAILLRDGYVAQYEFGFKRAGNRVLCWHYDVDTSGALTSDDRAGKIIASADVSGATDYNHLWTSVAWWGLSEAERQSIQAGLPIQRTSGDSPGDGAGYWSDDNKYAAGGIGLGRRSFRLI